MRKSKNCLYKGGAFLASSTLLFSHFLRFQVVKKSPKSHDFLVTSYDFYQLKFFTETEVMKCAIAESYTHIGQVQIDKSEVKNRASEEHNRRGDDHTGTPVRERELRIILELTWYTS